MLTLLSLLVPLILISSIYAWWGAVGRIRRGVPLVPYQPRRPVPWDVLDLLLALLIMAAAQMAAVLIARQFLPPVGGKSLEELDVESRAVVILAAALASCATMGLSLAAIRLRTGASLRDLGFSAPRLLDDMRLGLVAFVMLAPPVYVIQLILTQWFESKHPLIELLRENPDPAFLIISGFAAVVAAPVVEEYLFRLLLQGWMEKVVRYRGQAGWISTREDYRVPWPAESGETHREQEPLNFYADELRDQQNPYLSPNVDEAWDEPAEPTGRMDRLSWLPILASSTVFALLHWAHGPDWVPLLFLAIGLGYLYSRTHRLVPCIVVHFLLNGLSMLALLAELWKVVPEI